jgi:D-serine deaminase-like pyridoxal phosphate-dependent protein
MPLLGQIKLNEYEVLLQDGDDILYEYVVASNSEDAAYTALELSSRRNCTLKDVRMSDEW